LTFGAIQQQPQQPDLAPHFLPKMSQAKVDVPAVKRLLGQSALSDIVWEDTYLRASGQDIGNPGQVFARLLPATSTPLTFAAEKAGGLVAPTIDIKGLSRALGPVGGGTPNALDDLVGGTFDPKNVFDPDKVKLLGGIALGDIIRPITFPDAANLGQLPQLLNERTGNVISTHYRWHLEHDALVDFKIFVPGTNASFTLDATVEPPSGSTPSFHIAGALTDFEVVLLPSIPLISIHFDSVTFTAEQDKKPDVAVKLGTIKFLGPLAFVNTLAQVIPLDGFKDPPSLDLLPPPNSGLAVGFSLGLPTVAIGVMTLQNISLAATFHLYFVDRPVSFRFAFCERQQPFILTVSLFGGGGFFAIELDVQQVTLIEAALEFGASVALNLGVASGQATIMGGFYFQKAGSGFQVIGYLRAAGSLSVLGIISVSCEFYLGLAYASKDPLTQPHAGKLWGQAQLTVKIEILFFSESVSITMEREFAGSDPTFRQLLALGDWGTYCQAFDAYPPVPGD
jgi:hypothetical protein